MNWRNWWHNSAHHPIQPMHIVAINEYNAFHVCRCVETGVMILCHCNQIRHLLVYYEFDHQPKFDCELSVFFSPHFLFECDNSYMHKSQTMKMMKNDDDDDGWRPTTTKTIESLIPISSHWHKWVLLFVSMYIILVCDMRKGKARTGWNHESNPIVSVSKCCYLLFLLLLFRQLLLFLLFFTSYSHKKKYAQVYFFFLHLPLHLSFNSSSIQYTELALHINIEMWFKNVAYKHFGQSLTGNSNICENWNNNYGDSL